MQTNKYIFSTDNNTAMACRSLTEGALLVDNWCHVILYFCWQARNDGGQTGYIPEAYVQVERQHISRQLSVSSDGSHASHGLSKAGLPYSSSASLTDYEVQTAMSNEGAMSLSGQTVGELHCHDGHRDDTTLVMLAELLLLSSQSMLNSLWITIYMETFSLWNFQVITLYRVF